MIRKKILDLLAKVATTFPFIIIGVALVISGFAFNEARQLTLKTGQMDLTPESNPVRKKFFNFLQNFKVLDNVYILMTFQDEKIAKECASIIERKLEKAETVNDVFIHIDMDAIMQKFLYLIKMDLLDDVLKGIDTKAYMLKRLTEEQKLESLFGMITDEMKPDPKKLPDLDEIEEQLNLVTELLKAMVSFSPQDKNTEKEASTIWRKAFFPDAQEDHLYDDEGYILSKKAKKMLLIVKSARALTQQDEQVEYFLTVRKAVEETISKYPSISVGYAGAPAITYDEKQTVEGDLLFSTLLSLTGITVLFMVALRTFLHPIMGVSTLLISLLWTFGLTHLAIGHLTLVSTAFTATLIGLGIGFGIHIVSCFEEASAKGSNCVDAVKFTLEETGPGLITGAMTSAAAFYTMCLTEFTAFQELGFIAGSGLIITLFNMLVLLPAFLTAQARILGTKRGTPTDFLVDALPDEEERPWLNAVGEFSQKHAMVIVFLFGLLFCAALPTSLLNKFDYNILNLQASSSPSVLNEQELIRDFNISPEFNALIVPDPATAEMVTEKLRLLPSVALVESISDLIPADTRIKQDKVAKLTPFMEELNLTRKNTGYPNERNIANSLKTIKNTILKLRMYAFIKGKHSLVKMTSNLEKSIEDWEMSFNNQPYEIALNRLTLFERKIFDDLMNDMRKLKKAFEAEPYTLQTLPKAVTERYIGKSGEFVVYVTPSVDVREELYAKKFIKDTGEVWGNFTGLPVIKDEMVALIQGGFYAASFYALIALTLMVYFDFNNFYHTLVIIFSLICGTTFTLSGMYLAGIKFNPANFVALPIILGIGVDNGVHIMQRFLGGTSLRNVILSTGKAITLNSMTSIIGFGSLAFSSYQGFGSLGKIMVSGVVTCYISAIVMQPALMYLLFVNPVSIKDSLKERLESILSFKSS